jgi:hypothetical protein
MSLWPEVKDMATSKPGRLGHGYEIRVQHTGQLCADYQVAWAAGEQLPTEWGQVKQEAVEDETVEKAQIYRVSERKKNMQYRNVLDEYTREGDE